jgi:hypothetical protein
MLAAQRLRLVVAEACSLAELWVPQIPARYRLPGIIARLAYGAGGVCMSENRLELEAGPSPADHRYRVLLEITDRMARAPSLAEAVREFAPRSWTLRRANC